MTPKESYTVFFGPCSSSSPRCTAPATTSSCSTRPRDGTLPTAEQWRALSDRHTGIGFDQAMVIERAATRRHAGLLSHLQRRRRRGGAMRQWRSLRRIFPAPARRCDERRDPARQPRGPDPGAHPRRPSSYPWTWVRRISIRSRCRSTPPPRRTCIRSRSPAPKSRSARCRWAIRTPFSRSPPWRARPWTAWVPPSSVIRDSRSA